MLPTEIADNLINGISKALSSGEIQIIEYSYPVDGKEYSFEARLAPIGNAEVVSIVRDVTKLDNIKLLAKVYDLGKVNMPEQLVHTNLLDKESQLTDAEREVIRRHPEIGFRIASSSPELSQVADLILSHHENYDGSGYPLGLKGENIELECRIIAIIIAYSAMTNYRPYAKKLQASEALQNLERCAGAQFDPHLVEEFMKLL